MLVRSIHRRRSLRPTHSREFYKQVYHCSPLLSCHVVSRRAVEDVRLEEADVRVWRQRVLKQVCSIPTAATGDYYHVHCCAMDIDDVRAADRASSWAGKVGRSSLRARRRRRGTGATRKTWSSHEFVSPIKHPTIKVAQQREANFLKGWWLVVGVELVVVFKSGIQEWVHQQLQSMRASAPEATATEAYQSLGNNNRCIGDPTSAELWNRCESAQQLEDTTSGGVGPSLLQHQSEATPAQVIVRLHKRTLQATHSGRKDQNQRPSVLHIDLSH